MSKQYYQKYDMPIVMNSKPFQEILQFYMFECPVNDPLVSIRGKKFKDYGFVGTTKYGKLKSEMLKAATDSLKRNYCPCKAEKVDAVWNEKMRSISPPDEYCVFNETSKGTKMESLFVAIRNAFAHGSFTIKKYGRDRIYFLANDHNGVKARMALHESTLLAWRELIVSGCEGGENEH